MVRVVRRFGLAAGRFLLLALLTVFVCVLGVLITVLPLNCLPGDFQTGFVDASWVKLAYALWALAVLSYRLAPLAQSGSSRRPTLRFASKFLWRFTTAMLLAVWPPALLAWANAYGSNAERTHDMVVIGSSSTRIPPAVTPIEHIRLEEVGSGWQADLERTKERERFSSPGSCIWIKVREGRLGLDWISDTQPILCRADVR